jgi:succinyl-diaminopimelate desuccinylase
MPDTNSHTIDPVAFSQALIRCPSVTPEEGGTLGVLAEALTPLGFTCTRLKFADSDTPDVENLYARFGDGAPHFCFAGHVDVVPVGAQDAWTVDPFGGEIKDGRLYGRGASDMKSAVAAFASAAAAFIDRNGAPRGSISLLITGDEEGPAINGTRKMLEWIAERGETIDACVVGEPTSPETLGDMVKIGRRGSMSCWLTVRGTQGHTAYPHLADNPVHRLVAALGALTATPLDEGTEHFQPSTLQITTFDVGNTATNVIPETATAAFNIRFCDLHSSASLTSWIEETVRSAVDAVGPGGSDGDVTFDYMITGESFLTPPGPLSDLVSGVIEEVTGVTPELSTTGGTSDARFIKNYCPVVEFGLVGKTMHKIDECSDIDDITRLAEIYRLILERYFAAD